MAIRNKIVVNNGYRRADVVNPDVLLLSTGAGIANAGLITMMASADAFAARLLASTHHAAELSTLQMRNLSTSLADLSVARSERTAAATGFVMGAQQLPPGAPVVT